MSSSLYSYKDDWVQNTLSSRYKLPEKEEEVTYPELNMGQSILNNVNKKKPVIYYENTEKDKIPFDSNIICSFCNQSISINKESCIRFKCGHYGHIRCVKAVGTFYDCKICNELTYSPTITFKNNIKDLGLLPSFIAKGLKDSEKRKNPFKKINRRIFKALIEEYGEEYGEEEEEGKQRIELPFGDIQIAISICKRITLNELVKYGINIYDVYTHLNIKTWGDFLQLGYKYSSLQTEDYVDFPCDVVCILYSLDIHILLKSQPQLTIQELLASGLNTLLILETKIGDLISLGMQKPLFIVFYLKNKLTLKFLIEEMYMNRNDFINLDFNRVDLQKLKWNETVLWSNFVLSDKEMKNLGIFDAFYKVNK